MSAVQKTTYNPNKVAKFVFATLLIFIEFYLILIIKITHNMFKFTVIIISHR